MASTMQAGLLIAATLIAAPPPAATQTNAPLQSLAQWRIEMGAPDGVITLSGKPHRGYHRAYQCARFAVARAVVTAVPSGRSTAQTAALKVALRRHGCTPARGTYQVHAVGREVEINHGPEASENWTALDAMTASGRRVGLVFDSSPYAITE